MSFQLLDFLQRRLECVYSIADHFILAKFNHFDQPARNPGMFD